MELYKVYNPEVLTVAERDLMSYYRGRGFCRVFGDNVCIAAIKGDAELKMHLVSQLPDDLYRELNYSQVSVVKLLDISKYLKTLVLSEQEILRALRAGEDLEKTAIEAVSIRFAIPEDVARSLVYSGQCIGNDVLTNLLIGGATPQESTEEFIRGNKKVTRIVVPSGATITIEEVV